MYKKQLADDSSAISAYSELGTSVYPFQREIECFFAIYKSGSLSEAAHSLDLDQGNLSKTLKQLETKIKKPLFYRHHRGLQPTNEGKRLFQILDKMHILWKKESHRGLLVESAMDQEPLRVGLHSSLGMNFLPKFFYYLNKKKWDIEIDIQLCKSREVTRLVMERKLDFGIVANTIKSKDLITRPLATESIEMISKTKEKSGKKILLINPDMLFSTQFKNKIVFDKTIEIKDYNVIAEICSSNIECVGILPNGVHTRYPNLHVLETLKNKITIHLITYPGSSIADDLTELTQYLRKKTP